MKKLILILFVTSSIICFAQKRKEIIKHIKEFKKNEILTASYSVDANTLRTNIIDYFSNYTRGWYNYHRNTHDFYNVQRDVSYICTEIYGYPVQTKTKVCYGKEYLQIFTNNENNGIGIKLRVYSKIEKGTCVCTGLRSQVSAFNQTGLRKYLFEQICHNEYHLPNELSEKIRKFNSLQKKGSKKIIKGRDY
ncbi:MAG: hypothetical protein K8R74_16460 [Bacteroidales bacterium]|nr:hypothetical protein [Bacteroidales bacterium]